MIMTNNSIKHVIVWYMHDIVEHEINLTVLLSSNWKTGDYNQDYQRHKSENKWTNGDCS